MFTTNRPCGFQNASKVTVTPVDSRNERCAHCDAGRALLHAETMAMPVAPPPDIILPYAEHPSPRRRVSVGGPPAQRRARRYRNQSAVLDDLLLGPAHAFATMQPTPASARNAPMATTEQVDIPVSALSARRTSSNTAATGKMAKDLIAEGRFMEENARERVARLRAKLQREETRRSSVAAVELSRLKKTEEAARLKADLAILHGKVPNAGLCFALPCKPDHMRNMHTRAPQPSTRHLRQHSSCVRAP